MSGVVGITLVETVTEIQTQELSRENYFAKQNWQISNIFTEQNFIFAADNTQVRMIQIKVRCWHECRHCSWCADRQLTGNCISGLLFSP